MQGKHWCPLYDMVHIAKNGQNKLRVFGRKTKKKTCEKIGKRKLMLINVVQMRQLGSSKHQKDQVKGETGPTLQYGFLFASQQFYTVSPPIINVKPSTKFIPPLFISSLLKCIVPSVAHNSTTKHSHKLKKAEQTMSTLLNMVLNTLGSVYSHFW